MTNYNNLPDPVLFSLLKSGDKRAYAQIYDRYKWLLHQHAYKKLSDREEARDVVQSVFATLWEKRETIQVKSNLAGYLYTSVRNTILNLIAHKQIQTKYIVSFQSWYQDSCYSTENHVREREIAKIIEQEIAELPPKMREVFQLSRNFHLSHKEIAVALNLSEQTVRTQVRNALRILRLKVGIFSFFLIFREFFANFW